MQYLGGKTSIAKKLCEYINQFSHDKTYYEPFVGGLSVLQHVKAKARYASDICAPLIQLYLELQNGWIPPDVVSEALYHEAKQGLVSPQLQAFIGFGCSFGAKWFGGYARNKKGQNYARCARNSLLKKMNTCMDVKFSCQPYTALTPLDSVIYCDPPYQGTTEYGYVKSSFDYDLFWNTIRKWSANNIVVVSEYRAPADFECVLEIPKTTMIRNKGNESERRIERLFKYKENRMKTLFLCCENNRANHLNEEYDEILYVTDKISTENMEEYHHRIKDSIRLAANQDTDRKVSVYIDGPSPYVWLTQQLAIEMKETDKLDIILPEVKEIVPPPEYNEIE